MELVFIHGPPAAGKLTVARELSRLTGYWLFHNHLTLDLVSSLVDSKDPLFWKLVDKIRMDILEYAAANNVKGIVFTFGSIASNNFAFLRKIIRAVEDHKGKVHLVHLFCEAKELYRRVRNRSRRKFQKIMNPEEVKRSLKKWDFSAELPSRSTFRVDNTYSSAKQVARKIKAHFELPKVEDLSATHDLL